MATAEADRARIRDVPRFCTCVWSWSHAGHYWIRAHWTLGCPWHTRPPSC